MAKVRPCSSSIGRTSQGEGNSGMSCNQGSATVITAKVLWPYDGDCPR